MRGCVINLDNYVSSLQRKCTGKFSFYSLESLSTVKGLEKSISLKESLNDLYISLQLRVL